MQDRYSLTPLGASQSHRCKVLAKKGFLTLKNVTSSLAVLLYSSDFQLGALFHLPAPQAGLLSEELSFANSAMTMILTEFQSLGVRKEDVVTYAIGGSATEDTQAVSAAMVRDTLSTHGLTLTASDLGGRQTRSIWMDVETGRTIIRSVLLEAPR